MRFAPFLTCLALILICRASADDAAALRFFETEIRPLLAEHCHECHGPKKAKNGLRLDHIDPILAGGKTGPALIPGKPAESLLIKAVKGTDPDLKMPPKSTLPSSAIVKLEKWIQGGAHWPAETATRGEVDEHGFTAKDRAWWAIQSVKDPAVPKAPGTWARNEIDRFVARKHKENGLTPAPEANRLELVRRAYFDLHGLPPTPEEADAFVNDPSPDAWSRLIKKLLADKRYGERWAQHWLDVVRFAESDGYNEDAFRPAAGAYRDYVIRSFNQDKPYDRFVREQLAGDELEPDNPDVVIGTAFLRHGIYEWNQRNARMHWDLIVNEMTRATSEAFLGVSMGCAQCHDHKFDPILQKDYFALQAFLSSVRWPITAELGTPPEKTAHAEKQQQWEEATQAIRDEMLDLARPAFDNNLKYTIAQFPDDIQAIYHKPDAEKSTYEKQLSYLVYRQVHRATNRFDFVKALKSKPAQLKRYQELEVELKKFDSLKPQPLPEAFVATEFGPQPAETWMKTRTSQTKVEPAFLTLLNPRTPQPNPTAHTTGRRLELANWIADKDNPLSTRLIVNRVWQRHFGSGIVATPNDFGTLGEPPTHPELLDWLTSRFLEGGWKIKPLHELIMNSAAYRQTSRREPSKLENRIDPGNRFLWRFHPTRLDAEQVRDAMLTVSGELRDYNGGKSVSGTTPERSVYVIRKRNRPDEMLSGFDAPLGFESSADRIATTTPIQSLLLANGSWALERSTAFARRLLAGKTRLATADVDRAYRLAFGRDATDAEADAALEFINAQTGTVGPPPVEDKYPNEKGLRPTTQHFRSTKGLGLAEKTLWLQPGSRFERLHVQKPPDLGDEFTVEAVTILDRIYPDASVNTLISRWNGSQRSHGWNLGITSEKSRYQPRNFILQLIGKNFQDETVYEVIASGLRLPLGKPVYLAAAISANTSTTNKTGGSVTFYLKDLSDPGAKLETATVDTAVVDKIQNPALQLLVGGRASSGHQWDGQLARLTISEGALPAEQLLVGTQHGQAARLLDWTFRGEDGQRPAPETAWLPTTNDSAKTPSSPMLAAVTDFCHALFNANEFLYLH
ncbi:MAG: PSD1 domain-containing protein [Verrucomicrobiae bacterium]|nr:PSD1 domain-containing protein [Verrucomicrobiae bacterium]